MSRRGRTVPTKRAPGYDSAGRLQYETVSKETGSTTNMYRTGYSYSNLTYGRQVVRTEQEYTRVICRLTRGFDGLALAGEPVTGGRAEVTGGRKMQRALKTGGRKMTRADSEELGFELRRRPSSACTRRQRDQYDKDGNRTRFHRNVAGGYTSSYGQAMDLGYTFDVRNNLSAIADADDANYILLPPQPRLRRSGAGRRTSRLRSRRVTLLMWPTHCQSGRCSVREDRSLASIRFADPRVLA